MDAPALRLIDVGVTLALERASRVRSFGRSADFGFAVDRIQDRKASERGRMRSIIGFTYDHSKFPSFVASVYLRFRGFELYVSKWAKIDV